MIKTIFLSMVGCCGSGTSAPTLATDLKPGQVYLIFESQARYIYLFPKVRPGTYIFSKARPGTFYFKPRYISFQARYIYLFHIYLYIFKTKPLYTLF